MVRGQYHQGQVLHERFALDLPLRAGTSAQLWTARDAELETSILLRIYSGPADADPTMIDTIKRIARHSRQVHHPHVARIHDVHVRNEQTLVSLDAHAGTLLESWLDHAEPLPYRRVVEVIRPLIEALLHIHERGGEHGQLDTSHVLVDDDERLVVLPADGTRPARSDMRQLGRLMTALLTGGNQPDEGGDLNDLADRLHEGRTIPALLNQLINDLDQTEPAVRPASMRDVLHRLDQLEEFVAPVPDQGRAPRPGQVVPIRAAPPRSDRAPRSRFLGGKLAWVVAPLALLIAAVALIMGLRRPETRAVPVAEVTPPTSAEATGETASPREPAGKATPDPASVLAAKHDAEESLGAYLAVRGRADSIGAARWGHEAYARGASEAAEADQLFVAEQYEPAAEKYRSAAGAFGDVVDSAPQVLRRLLDEGQGALDAPDATLARTTFESALLIEPGNDAARIGLKRAETIDEVHRQLASGLAHENEGRLALAFAHYTAAVEIDPMSDDAVAATQRIKQRIADEEFQAMMSAGLDAYHRGDLEEARRRLLEARRLRPDGSDITEALAMVDEARLRAEVVRLRESAQSHEAHEQWPAARHDYRQVLAIDPAIEFAQQGVTRCEAMIRLVELTAHYLASPELLVQRGTREDAKRLVEEIEALEHRGSGLQASYVRLVEQVREANRPRRVVLQSDGQTQVDVYQVERYGTLRTIELELLPGRYTVVGHRTGFKDVRLVLRIEVTSEVVTLEVICREPI